MLKSASSLLTPQEPLSFGYINQNGVFLTFHNIHNESIEIPLENLKKRLLDQTPNSLDDFHKKIEESLESVENFSLAAIFQMDSILYLVTIGEGEIYIKRENDFNKIISGNKTASGFIKPTDLFVLGFHTFFENIEKNNLVHIMGLPTVSTIARDLEVNMKEDMKNELVMFTKFAAIETPIQTTAFSPAEVEIAPERREVDMQEDLLPSNPRINFLTKWKEKLMSQAETNTKGKKITIVLAALLLLLLIWSVGFGIQRRNTSETNKKISFYKQEIEAKLGEASDLSTLNTERAKLLVQDAKNDFADLQKAVGEKNYKLIEPIQNEIATKERSIFKQEDKTAEEFYDLHLISDNATGSIMSLDGDQMNVVDNESKKLYVISVSKKSKDVIENNSIQDVNAVTSSDGDIYFGKSDGIYKANDDKQSVIIKNDSWGSIKALEVFNGNIYVLDSGKQDIYKYLVAENGYSDKASYFKSSPGIDLSSANSLAVDGSLYIGTTNHIYKFTTGIQEDFNVSLPNDQNISISKIVTNQDLNKVYVLDKQNSTVYVVTKDGQYEKQIDSSIFKNASDISVSEEEKGIFVLVKNKIYKVSLE